MFRANQVHRLGMSLLRLVVACSVIWPVSSGCGPRKRPTQATKLTPRYQALPPKQVPAYLKDTIFERCDLTNTGPYPVSAFGLVANLRGTGDCYAGTAVREHILRTMVKRGFGSRQQGLENQQPEDILKDPRFAIVRVDGLIPPGARSGQRFDVYVSALDGNNTTSLACGDLYRTDLKVNGANLQAPGYTIDVWAIAEGSIFVNPAYALQTNPTTPEARLSLRRGVVLGGGVAALDRPLFLRLRQPQLSMARAIEYRIDQQYQDRSVAAAKDEALIGVFVPAKYGDDWERFAGVTTHLFFDSTPQFAVIKAKQLAEEAVKPDAPLMDISYCWEGLGQQSLPFIIPLMTHERPEVAYAAARAAAFIGESAAQTVLMEMACTSGHPFQISAVQTLGKLPSSPAINQMLRRMLDTDQTLVRVEAYRALAGNQDSAVISQTVRGKFILDIVPSQGPPIVYAARSGLPRIALIGSKLAMNMPVVFTAMDNRLSISSEQDRQLVTVFYRGPELRKPVTVLSRPDLAELIGRLGGEGQDLAGGLGFAYCDIVAILQLMSDQKRLTGISHAQRVPAVFVLQEAPSLERAIEEAPVIPDQTQAGALDSTVDSAINAHQNK